MINTSTEKSDGKIPLRAGSVDRSMIMQRGGLKKTVIQIHYGYIGSMKCIAPVLLKLQPDFFIFYFFIMFL